MRPPVLSPLFANVENLQGIGSKNLKLLSSFLYIFHKKHTFFPPIIHFSLFTSIIH